MSIVHQNENEKIWADAVPFQSSELPAYVYTCRNIVFTVMGNSIKGVIAFSRILRRLDRLDQSVSAFSPHFLLCKKNLEFSFFFTNEYIGTQLPIICRIY